MSAQGELKVKQWERMNADFKNIKSDEELLITWGGRQYVIRVATPEDMEKHFRMGAGESE